ncbi:MAG TPA: ethanolamine ammonia-lyase subunit EutC [Anaerolineales bacterium]|nr:ethanolamine ammonia-lyase subunit EutC [Anaerolineales bacterium]HNQ96385.1 ethanolamine ammonia-lyase subunit EutC [Anaerolineales bacterium]HNS62111.1 ethanolamine ammonia-lyase subunit EutC [Anaerolineales bacterium]
MDDTQLNALVDAIVRELKASGAVKTPASSAGTPASVPSTLASSSTVPSKPRPQSPVSSLSIDLPDPTLTRSTPRVKNPKDADGLKALMASTTARIGVGRAGPRYSTAELLLFQGDHAVTQDALYRDVDQKLLDEFNLFTVQTKITGGKQEYLLRPDLGRLLNDDAKRIINEKCQKNVNVQLVVGDGLSAAAIEANLRQIFPVLKQGVQTAGLTFGTPFFVKYARVGVMNDVGELIKPDVVILLIGERPGLGRAESMSAYMGYKPKYGDTDADRDVVCNIFENGGTNPLEGGAFVVQIAQKMRKHQASGVKLKLAN